MKIALFGGAFDPPHLGHQRVAEEIIAQQLVDQVWYVPVYIHPWEARYGKLDMVPYEQRLEMVKLMLPSQTQLQEFREVSFTYPTLVYFSQKYPEHDFSWLMGSEYLDRFDDFLAGHPRLIDFQFFIYPRTGHPLAPLQSNMTPLTEVEEVAISSSDVRERIQTGQSIFQLVHPAVAAYIQEHQLYLKRN